MESFSDIKECSLLIKKIKTVIGIPLFFCENPQTAFTAVKVLYSAGFELIEFTNRGSSAISTFSDISGRIRAEVPGAVLGAGTITDVLTAETFIDAGAGFIVGPNFSPEICSLCMKHKILYIPGVMTVNEALAAYNSGCCLLKLFPGEILSPAFIKAVKAPLPQLSFMVTGGVRTDEDSVKSWMSAGADALGFGSQLVSGDMLENRDFTGLKSNAEKLFSILNRYRS